MHQIQDEQIRIWFPDVKTGTGTDTYTQTLVHGLQARGLRAKIDWLPHRAEYLPWTVAAPNPPSWATLIHTNCTLHRRFVAYGLPLVATVHHCAYDPDFTHYSSFPRRLYHRLWISRCARHGVRNASAVTAVSHFTAQKAINLLAASSVAPIYNWTDIETFSPDDRIHPRHPFNLLFVGKLSVRKGADLIPKLMRALGPDFRLTVSDSSNHATSLSKQSDNIHIIPRPRNQADLAQVYRNCDALLYPSRLEGFGLVALEAQACGRPIICMNTSSLPEVVHHEVTGFVCPREDIYELAQAAQRLRQNPELWQRMAACARYNAATNFSPEAALNRYIELYRSVLGRVSYR